MQKPDSERDAALLIAMVKQIAETGKQLDPGPEQKAGSTAQARLEPFPANRAVEATRELSEALHEWFKQFDGYDPTFTWWGALSYKRTPAKPSPASLIARFIKAGERSPHDRSA
jgi:hypothetical protein